MVNASDELPVDSMPNVEIKCEIMDADLPIVTFENSDMAAARALYGNKRKKYLKKYYKCSTCTYVTGRKWMLTLHRQWHLTEKPYRCRICDKRFSTQNECKRHSLKHVK